MGIEEILKNCISRPDGTAICWDSINNKLKTVKVIMDDASFEDLTPEEAKKILIRIAK